MLLRLLVAGELYFNAPFYADHDAFNKTSRDSTDLTLGTLFSIALTKAGDEKFLETGLKSEAVKAEALVACTRGKWSSFMHVLGLASVVSKPVRSIYPDVSFRFRSLMHRSINPRASATSDQPREDVEPLNILWSRDGNFDNRPGVWFEPNHFVPVISEEENIKCPDKRQSTAGIGRKTKQQGTLFSFMETKPMAETSADNSHPTGGPSLPAQKRNAATAKLSEEVQLDVKKSAASIKHKIRYKWKDGFPWLTIREDQAMMCSVLQRPRGSRKEPVLDRLYFHQEGNHAEACSKQWSFTCPGSCASQAEASARDGNSPEFDKRKKGSGGKRPERSSSEDDDSVLHCQRRTPF